MSQEWLIAMGLFLVFEGLMPALFPKQWRKTIFEIAKSSEGNIRTLGFASMLIGLIWIYFVT